VGLLTWWGEGGCREGAREVRHQANDAFLLLGGEGIPDMHGGVDGAGHAVGGEHRLDLDHAGTSFPFFKEKIRRGTRSYDGSPRGTRSYDGSPRGTRSYDGSPPSLVDVCPAGRRRAMRSAARRRPSISSRWVVADGVSSAGRAA